MIVLSLFAVIKVGLLKGSVKWTYKDFIGLMEFAVFLTLLTAFIFDEIAHRHTFLTARYKRASGNDRWYVKYEHSMYLVLVILLIGFASWSLLVASRHIERKDTKEVLFRSGAHADDHIPEGF